jgi:hypothetical protein
MQWYVYLITISAVAILNWAALELLGRPVLALFELRRKVVKQLRALGNISLPKPRETAVSSREIQEYDRAMRNVREAQRTFHDLGSQLLAFGESEPVARNVLLGFGLNLVAAGNALIELSATYSRPDTDRAGLCNLIERTLRLTDAVTEVIVNARNVATRLNTRRHPSTFVTSTYPREAS